MRGPGRSYKYNVFDVLSSQAIILQDHISHNHNVLWWPRVASPHSIPRGPRIFQVQSYFTRVYKNSHHATPKGYTVPVFYIDTSRAPKVGPGCPRLGSRVRAGKDREVPVGALNLLFLSSRVLRRKIARPHDSHPSLVGVWKL